MQTKKVQISKKLERSFLSGPKSLRNLYRKRFMTMEEWIEEHSSGTLRKNKRIGFAISSQYKVERVAWEWGWCFEMLPASYVSYGRPVSAGDCRAVTESGWHIDRMISRNPFGDKIVPAYIHAAKSAGKNSDQGPREGLGVVIKKTNAPWIPKGHVIFAFIATYDPITHEWSEPENPC